jgi:hypothetical protein
MFFNSTPCYARHGMSHEGKERHGKERKFMAWKGKSSHGLKRKVKVWHGKARHGKAWHGNE